MLNLIKRTYWCKWRSGKCRIHKTGSTSFQPPQFLLEKTLIISIKYTCMKFSVVEIVLIVLLFLGILYLIKRTSRCKWRSGKCRQGIWHEKLLHISRLRLSHSILHRLDGLWGYVDDFNNRFHRIVKEEGAVWVDMTSHIDPEELELYSERDGLHISDHGTAVYLTQLDAELTRVMNPRPHGHHLPSFINRLLLPEETPSKTSQEGEWSLSSIGIWSRRSMLQQHPCRGLAGSSSAESHPKRNKEKPTDASEGVGSAESTRQVKLHSSLLSSYWRKHHFN